MYKDKRECIADCIFAFWALYGTAPHGGEIDKCVEECTPRVARVVDQNDIQKRGGICGRYPVSCLIRDMLAEADLLVFGKPLHVIDLTFGEGLFYMAIKDRVRVAAVDIRRLEWRVKPVWFRIATAQGFRSWWHEAKAALGNRVDVVVVDPPWQICRHGHGCHPERKHYRVSHAVGTPMQILQAGIDLAMLLRVPLLYHYSEPLYGKHIIGPIAFTPHFAKINKKAENYASYFGILSS